MKNAFFFRLFLTALHLSFSSFLVRDCFTRPHLKDPECLYFYEIDKLIMVLQLQSFLARNLR